MVQELDIDKGEIVANKYKVLANFIQSSPVYT